MQSTHALPTEAATIRFGEQLAAVVHAGLVIYLHGELGAGKTTLARGLLRGLGVRERVKSPTFTLVEPYNISSLYLYHFDFYRLRSYDEWVDAGFRDYFNRDSLCLVEWPEKAGPGLPAADLTADLVIAGAGRTLTLNANTEAGRNCLGRLQI